MENLSFRAHIKRNFVLAFPVIIGQLGHILVSVADTIMVGRVGVIPLASATFASTIYTVLMVFGMGVSYAITPLVAALGAGEDQKKATYFQSGLVLNLVLSLILCLLGAAFIPFLGYFGQDPAVAEGAKGYLLVMSVSLVPFMGFQTYRQFAEGMSNTFLPMIISILANLINVGLNWVMIYGHFGVEPMGLLGAGYATLIARVIMFLMMHIAMRKQVVIFQKVWHLDKIKQLWKVGWPSGMQYVFEVGAFATSAVMVGWISAEAQAAHQIAINLAAISFMAATGLGAAGTIRIGNQIGLRNKHDLKMAGFSSILTVSALMLFAGSMFICFRQFLVSLYIENAQVEQLAAGLLLVAAGFQLSDGIQAVGLGILRGFTDVKIPTIVTFVAYWGVSIPLGYFLAFEMGYGAYGIWVGLLVGLSLAAIAHFFRFQFLLRKLDF